MSIGVSQMEKGSVSWFNSSKGFGFLKRKNAADVFVHFSSIQGEGYRTLAEGEEVEFDIEMGPKGKYQAVNVRKVEK
jgi:cold shock protein